MVTKVQRRGSYLLQVTWGELGRDSYSNLPEMTKMMRLRVEAAGRGGRRNSPARETGVDKAFLRPCEPNRVGDGECHLERNPR